MRHLISTFAFLCIFSLTFVACSEEGQSPSLGATSTQTASPSTASSQTTPNTARQPRSTSSSVRQVPIQSGLASVIVSFYQALEMKDYSHAYSYMDSNATLTGHKITEAIFTQVALATDSTSGPINNFTFIANPTAHTQITTTVTRTTNSRYHAHLQFQQENGNWKIRQIDIL